MIRADIPRMMLSSLYFCEAKAPAKVVPDQSYQA